MPVIERNQNILYTSTVEQLSNLLKKVKDLTTINARIIMRFEKNNVLLISFVGESFKDIHAFKNYVFPLGEIMTIKKGSIDEPLFFIVKDGKKFHRIVENFLDYKDDIKCKISVDDENYINHISFNNEKLDIKIIGNNSLTVGSEISIDDINYLMDVEKSVFNFRINRADFFQIKKLGLIERIKDDIKSPLYINVVNKKLSIGETKWHVNITEVENEDITLSFPKIYFNTINPNDFIDIFVFEEFILCKYDDYNLMIVLETTV